MTKLRFDFSREELRKAGKFLAGFLAVFFALGFVSLLVPLQLVEEGVARTVLGTLGAVGWQGTLDAAQEPVVVRMDDFPDPIGISYLCTGLLETLVLVAAVLASFGIPWQKRWQGALGGLFISFIFNIIRIDATLLIVRAQGLGVGELAHDWLFRLALFLTVAGYYAVWFGWAVPKDPEKAGTQPK